jgi:hypothetical protein
MKEKKNMEIELKNIIATSPMKMWQNDLENFEKKYQVYRVDREKLQYTINKKK